MRAFLSCSYLPQDSSLQSETVHFKRGVCQQFCLPSHTVNLSEWADDEVWCSFLLTHAIPDASTRLLWDLFLLDGKSIFSPQLLFDVDKEIFPMVVQAVVDEGDGELGCLRSVIDEDIQVNISLVSLQNTWVIVTYCWLHLRR